MLSHAFAAYTFTYRLRVRQSNVLTASLLTGKYKQRMQCERAMKSPPPPSPFHAPSFGGFHHVRAFLGPAARSHSHIEYAHNYISSHKRIPVVVNSRRVRHAYAHLSRMHFPRRFCHLKRHCAMPAISTLVPSPLPQHTDQTPALNNSATIPPNVREPTDERFRCHFCHAAVPSRFVRWKIIARRTYAIVGWC